MQAWFLITKAIALTYCANIYREVGGRVNSYHAPATFDMEHLAPSTGSDRAHDHYSQEYVLHCINTKLLLIQSCVQL